MQLGEVTGAERKVQANMGGGWRVHQKGHVDRGKRPERDLEGKKILCQEQASPSCSHYLFTLPLCPPKKLRGKGQGEINSGSQSD